MTGLPSAFGLDPDVSELLTSAASDIDACMPKLLSLVRQVTRMETVMILSHDHREEGLYQVVTHLDTSADHEIAIGINDDFSWESGGCKRLLEERMIFSADMQADFPDHELSRQIGLHGYLSVPIELRPEKQIVATLCAMHPTPWDLPDDSLRALPLFAEVIAAAIERQREAERIRGHAQVAAEFLRSYTAAVAQTEHRLRTGLTVVSGCLGLMADDSEIPPRLAAGPLAAARRRADELEADLRELLSEARDYLDFAVEVQPISVAPIVVRAVESCAGISNGRLREPDIEEGVWVLADAAALRDVIEHLIDNAISHSAGDVAIRVETQDGSVVITVANLECDRSAGGAAHDGDEARVRSGSGVGLSVVRALVASMGGSIRATKSAEALPGVQVLLRPTPFRPVERV